MPAKRFLIHHTVIAIAMCMVLLLLPTLWLETLSIYLLNRQSSVEMKGKTCFVLQGK